MSLITPQHFLYVDFFALDFRSLRILGENGIKILLGVRFGIKLVNPLLAWELNARGVALYFIPIGVMPGISSCFPSFLYRFDTIVALTRQLNSG